MLLLCGSVATGCKLQFGADANNAARASGSRARGATAGGENRPASAVTTGLPATAAHPSFGWFVERVMDFPDAALGGTAQTHVDGTKALSFVAEFAIGEVAPSILATRHLPKTGASLATVKPITDAASLKAAEAIVAAAKKISEDESATITESSSCVEGAHKSGGPAREATDAFRFLKGGFNDHPYYARLAISGWDSAFFFMKHDGVADTEVLGLAIKHLQGFVARLRAMPPRKETSRSDS